MIHRLVHNKFIYALILVYVALLLVPLLGINHYYLQILTVAAIWAIVVIGLDLLVGYTGYVSFGHAAYIGIGGYTSAILVTKLGFSFWIAMPVAIMLTGMIGFLISIPSFRLTGTYFAIGTLAFGEIVNVILANWTPVTGGVFGLIGIPSPFGSNVAYFYFVYGCLAVVSLAIYRLASSAVGKALAATRENEGLARSMGIDTQRMKRFVFTLSCMVAGLGGALLVHFNGFASPITFGVQTSLELIVMIIVGGAGTLIGPGFGAFILIFLGQYLAAFKELRLMVYGLVLILVIRYLSGGIAGQFLRVRRNAMQKQKRGDGNGHTAVSKS